MNAAIFRKKKCQFSKFPQVLSLLFTHNIASSSSSSSSRTKKKNIFSPFLSVLISCPVHSFIPPGWPRSAAGGGCSTRRRGGGSSDRWCPCCTEIRRSRATFISTVESLESLVMADNLFIENCCNKIFYFWKVQSRQDVLIFRKFSQGKMFYLGKFSCSKMC